MQDFEFDIVYKMGKYIGHVDFFSRNPVESSVSVNLKLPIKIPQVMFLTLKILYALQKLLNS